jgi:hypothetical protein
VGIAERDGAGGRRAVCVDSSALRSGFAGLATPNGTGLAVRHQRPSCAVGGEAAGSVVAFGPLAVVPEAGSAPAGP